MMKYEEQSRDEKEAEKQPMKTTIRSDGKKEYDGMFESIEQFDEFFMDDNAVFKL